MVQQRPRWWPRFSSTLRSTAVTARIGLVLGIAIAVLFLTGLLSHYQYEPWSWLPEPAKPVWGYRLTQGIHVATGIATIPLLLFNSGRSTQTSSASLRSGRSSTRSSGSPWRSWSPSRSFR